jgi:Predicted beta-xylosidase
MTKTETFTNPIALRGADPYLIKHGDVYYYCHSVGTGVAVRPCSNIHTITENESVVVYRAPEGGMYSKEYWAPELHFIRGEWYIYVAADDGDNYNHRMYVLKCVGDVPTMPFEMVGKIADATDKWAIDGTVLSVNNELYFAWSGWEGDVNVAQNIYISHMGSPTSIDGARVILSKPEFDWELLGGEPKINEGPSVIAKDGAVHIIYSASGSWCDDYCLGILTYRGGDILDPASWVKSPVPILVKAHESYGPGHNSFTTDKAGNDWIIYHANIKSGSGWGGRSVRAQRVEWDGDMPHIGAPAGVGAELSIEV